MDMKKEIELIELRAQVSLLYELMIKFTENINYTFAFYKIQGIVKYKEKKIRELEKQIQNEKNV